MKHLSRHVSLSNVEGVKAFISTKKFDSYKKLVDAYALYCQAFRIVFEKPKYKRTSRLPFVPLESEVDALIGGLPLKYACFCRVIKETGARPLKLGTLNGQCKPRKRHGHNKQSNKGKQCKNCEGYSNQTIAI